jgi:hypothetical protein
MSATSQATSAAFADAPGFELVGLEDRVSSGAE